MWSEDAFLVGALRLPPHAQQRQEEQRQQRERSRVKGRSGVVHASASLSLNESLIQNRALREALFHVR